MKSPLPPELLNVLGTGSGRVVVASSGEDEYSYTSQPYSAFTDCLLEALQGKAAGNKDGYARILDILVYLFDQVPKRSSGPQHPFVNKVLDLGDNFANIKFCQHPAIYGMEIKDCLTQKTKRINILLFSVNLYFFKISESLYSSLGSTWELMKWLRHFIFIAQTVRDHQSQR